MAEIRTAFARMHEFDYLASEFTAKRPGPKPQFTQTLDIAFSPEQVRRMTRRASAERRSRNSLIRDAVEAYLTQAEHA